MGQSDTQAGLQQGIAAAKAGRLDEARRRLQQALQADRSNVLAWLWLSSVVDDPDQKRICLQNVLHLEPDNPLARSGLAALSRQTTRRDAPEDTGKSVSADRRPPATETKAEPPQATAAPDGCPFCRQSTSPTAAACEHCGLPLVVDCPACGTGVDVEQPRCPDCGQRMGDFRRGADFFLALARAYEQTGRRQSLLRVAQAAQTLAPDRSETYVFISQALTELGRADEAIPSLQKILAQNSGDIGTALALGQTLHRLHRWKEAGQVYQRALAVAPQEASLHFAVGRLFMDLNQIKPALEHMETATKLDAENGLAWLLLGQLYEASGKLQPATKAYESAAPLLPNNSTDQRQALQRLSRLKPSLPANMTRSWTELLRQMLGPLLLCFIVALLDSGLRPWLIHWTGWAALLIAAFGAILWSSGLGATHNPVIRLLVGDEGLSSETARWTSAGFGAFCWLLALLIILLPINQSMPDVPQL
jgi:tetratricopeptide (TPR) repeat protein